jgi:hypothetical protein
LYSSSGGDYTLVDPTFAHLSAQKTEAKNSYDAAVVEWKTATPEDRPFYMALVDSAEKHFDAANKSLFAHINQPKVQLVPETLAEDSSLCEFAKACRNDLAAVPLNFSLQALSKLGAAKALTLALGKDRLTEVKLVNAMGRTCCRPWSCRPVASGRFSRTQSSARRRAAMWYSGA